MMSPRFIPSIDQLLQRPALVTASALHGRDRVVAFAREAADRLRASRDVAGMPSTEAQATAWLEKQVLSSLTRPASLRPVINATGVILHTNLGRAPLAAAAIAQAAHLAAGYSNLEYDLEAGTRGHRHVHAERLYAS